MGHYIYPSIGILQPVIPLCYNCKIVMSYAYVFPLHISNPYSKVASVNNFMFPTDYSKAFKIPINDLIELFCFISFSA